MIVRRTFTRDQLIAEVKREMALRGQIYPRMVTEGQLDQGSAEYAINAMHAVEVYLTSREPFEIQVNASGIHGNRDRLRPSPDDLGSDPE